MSITINIPARDGVGIVVNLTVAGDWDSATTYSQFDVVQHNGSSYYALSTNTNDEPPSAAWVVLAAKGGDVGWSPVLSVASDGAVRKVLEITDWVGGEGTKPDTGYVSSGGVVADIADADDLINTAALDSITAAGLAVTGVGGTIDVREDAALAAITAQQGTSVAAVSAQETTSVAAVVTQQTTSVAAVMTEGSNQLANIVAAAVAAGNVYTSTADALSNGVWSLASLVGGSGGTNGSAFQLAFSGGGGTGAAGWFVVSGGAVTSWGITSRGRGYTSAPTVSFAASSGLTGASAVAAISTNVPVNSYFLVGRALYQNQAGVAVLIDDSQGTLPTNYSGGFTDKNDNLSAGVDSTGAFSAYALDATTFSSRPMTEWKRRTKRQPTLNCSVSGLISYGQSWGLGNTTSGFYSTPGSFGRAYRFSANSVAGAGPRAQEGGGTVAQNHATLVDFAEEFRSSTSNGETPLGNAIRMVRYLLEVEDGLVQDTHYDYAFLGSAPANTNTDINGLDKGSAPYQRVVDDVTYGAALADTQLGKDYMVETVLWSQGQKDITNGTTRATYLSLYSQLYTDLNTDIKAITGQTQDIKVLTAQCSEYDQTDPKIALAQADGTAANANIVMATAMYGIPFYISSTNVHLLPQGYAVLGAYYGLVHKRVVIDGETWTGLRIRSVVRRGKYLYVRFWVPTPPIVIGALELFPTALTNSGLDCIKASDGTANAIVGPIAVTAPDTLRIKLTSAEAGTLRAGYVSWGTNLRDSQGDWLDAQAPRRWALHNPLQLFEASFT